MFISVALFLRDDIVRRRLEEAESLCKSENNIQELLPIQPTTNLLDVFLAIDKNEYPNIWRFVIRNLTIMPTTVACEQSFSNLKRTARINMSETTAKNFLFLDSVFMKKITINMTLEKMAENEGWKI